MNYEIQDAAVAALRGFLKDPADIERFEREIADLWVANDRELDGALGEIYDLITDWDHKFELHEVLSRLRDIEQHFRQSSISKQP